SEKSLILNTSLFKEIKRVYSFKSAFLFYICHILHVFVQKVSFIFFNTTFFIYFYKKQKNYLNYFTIYLFLLPSFIFHIMEIFYIKYSNAYSLFEEIEYILFTSFYLLIISRLIDCYFIENIFIFIFLIIIYNILSAKIGVFYNYTFYEKCFSDDNFFNRILLIIFENLPVYFTAIYISFFDLSFDNDKPLKIKNISENISFKPYIYICTFLYILTG
ncbi:putative transporter, partial [Pseudoloma neurophilia]